MHVEYVQVCVTLVRVYYVPDCVATETVLASTLAFLGTGRVMEALEERVGLTLLERPFSSFFTSSSSVPAEPQSHQQCLKYATPQYLTNPLQCMSLVGEYLSTLTQVPCFSKALRYS